MTQVWQPDEVAKAADALRRGELVAFPTETVYGLGGDGTSDQSVAAIYAAKERPVFNPLILHVADMDAATEIADLPAEAVELATSFWPGPLTIVAPVRLDAQISLLATAGLPTVAVRVPAHPLARRLLALVGRPVAAPSANPSGRLSPTSADHVLSGLAGKIAGVLDDGACAVGLESTIVGFGADGPQLLRPGGLSAEQIEQTLGKPLLRAGAGITAPGQLSSHYAPKAGLRLNAARAGPEETLLGFGDAEQATVNLSPRGDLQEAAANLFAALHLIDKTATAIAVSPIPETGLGRAINDRLRRAAAPRADITASTEDNAS